MNARLHIPVLLVVSAILFFTNLGGYDLWPPDEPRFAEVAREMMASGDYLVPRVNGQPYTEKPPVLFWLTALVSSPFGDVSETTARLPLAIGGMLTVLMTYLLARSLYGTRVAFWAGMILATTHRFWWQARFGQIDMILATCMTLALLCFWWWHKHRHASALVAFYLAIAIGVLTKGPPALIFPLLMVLAFYWGKKEDRKALHWVWGFALVCIIAAAWLVPARMAISVESGLETGDGIASNMFRQTIGRFFLGISHAKWPWFYLTHVPIDLLPWGLFLPWTLYWMWKHRDEGEEMRLLHCWTIPAFIFFSACIGKRSIYLLPLYPVFALFLSRSILDLMESSRSTWRRETALVWACVLLVLAGAPAFIYLGPYSAYWNNSLIVVGVLLGACGVQALFSALWTDRRHLMRDMSAHTVVIVLLCALVIFPAINSYKSARDFCAPMRRLGDQAVQYDLYSVGFSREEYIYYAKQFHVPVLCDLLPIKSMEALPLYEQARLQSKMQRDIQKAVRKVPIETWRAVSDEEIASLQSAVTGYTGTEAIPQQTITDYEAAATRRIEQLFEGMNGATPTFAMVLEEDWRWVLALAPSGRSFTVLSEENVGSRQVILLTNAPATAALARYSTEALAGAHEGGGIPAGGLTQADGAMYSYKEYTHF